MVNCFSEIWKNRCVCFKCCCQSLCCWSSENQRICTGQVMGNQCQIQYTSYAGNYIVFLWLPPRKWQSSKYSKLLWKILSYPSFLLKEKKNSSISLHFPPCPLNRNKVNWNLQWLGVFLISLFQKRVIRPFLKDSSWNIALCCR